MVGIGRGGVIGRTRTYYSTRFAVDFAGGDLSLIGKGAQVQARNHHKMLRRELEKVEALCKALGEEGGMFRGMGEEEARRGPIINMFAEADEVFATKQAYAMDGLKQLSARSGLECERLWGAR